MCHYINYFLLKFERRFPSKLSSLRGLEVLDLSLNCIRELPHGVHSMEVRCTALQSTVPHIL